MATLINEQQLRAAFDLHIDVGNGRLTPAIRAASRRLRSMIGDDAYNDALLDEPANSDRKED